MTHCFLFSKVLVDVQCLGPPTMILSTLSSTTTTPAIVSQVSSSSPSVMLPIVAQTIAQHPMFGSTLSTTTATAPIASQTSSSSSSPSVMLPVVDASGGIPSTAALTNPVTASHRNSTILGTHKHPTGSWSEGKFCAGLHQQCL